MRATLRIVSTTYTLLLMGVACCLMAFTPPELKRKIRKFNTQNGFPLKVVNSITQGKDGLMWFGGEAGLVRFDGYSFKMFKHDPDNPYSLSNNFVQSLFRDSRGNVWIATLKGLNRFDPKTEQFVRFEHTPNNPHTVVGEDALWISENAQGNLWIASSAGFTYLDQKKGKCIRYSRQNLPDLAGLRVLSLYEDHNGLLWVGTDAGGIRVFEVSEGVVTKKMMHLSQQSFLSSSRINSIAEDHLENVWLGTREGLVVYRRKENRFYTFHTNNSVLKGNIIRTLHEDSSHTLWIGVQDKGLYKLSLKDFESQAVENSQFTHVEGEAENHIYKRTIHAVYEDTNKNLWLGTNGEGINMISGLPVRFTRIQKKQTGEYEGSYLRFWGMCTDEEGNLWLGSDGDGIYKSTIEGHLLKHYTADGKKGSLTDNAILCAFRDHTNTLWFGTYAQGLFRYNKTTDSFIQYKPDPTNPHSLGSKDVRVIFEDSHYNIWVGTNGGGLHLLNKATGTFTRYTTKNSTISSDDIRTIIEDKQGGLWVGSFGGGVMHCDPRRGVFQRFFTGSGPGKNLSSNIVYALKLDKSGKLWIGTEGGGVAVYHPQQQTLQQFTEQKDLASSTIYALQEDREGNIWMSTNSGLSKYDQQDGRFYNYDDSDGLQGGQFNSCSSLYDRRTSLMAFAGTEGVTVFHPEQVRPVAEHPPVMLTGFQLFNKQVAVNPTSLGEKVLQQVISQTREITLQPNQSVFTFEFAALDFNFPERIQYAYQLAGLDKGWNYVGNQKTATYRYLSPGTYTFMVKAANRDMIWNKAYTSVKVIVLPPFWRTPLAFLLYVLLVGLIAYNSYIYKRKQVRLRKRLILAKAQRKKEHQLAQEKLSFFTEVSHEFRTPLTLMLGPLEEMLLQEDNQTPMGKKLKLVYRNAHKLLNLINKLLDYRKAETGKMMLKVQEGNIVTFVEEIYITFKELAGRKNVQLYFYPEKPVMMAWFDKEKLEMVLNNIISNSFKYLGSGNQIDISIQSVQESQATGLADKILIQVKDNGIGIPKDQLKYIFDWFYQGNNTNPMSSGIGLALAKKLVQLHKGRVFVQSREGEGSTFGFSIPVGKAHFGPEEIIEGTAPLLLNPLPDLLGETEEGPGKCMPTKGVKKLLLVEDEAEIRSFLKDYLQPHFYLIEAANGKEGLDMALTQHPDLIISDILMPEMNGIELCKTLKTNIRTSHIPVVLLTARASFTHHKEGLEMGAEAYIAKPFSPELLLVTINNLLRSRENTRRFFRNSFPVAEPAKKAEVPSADEKLLERINEVLKAHLEQPEFNVNELCKELGMSRSLFYKKVKTVTGVSPVEYLRSLRMQEAAQLLKTGRYKVFEVVYMVGFTDTKYFRQCFTKEFGYAPSECLKMKETEKL